MLPHGLMAIRKDGGVAPLKIILIRYRVAKLVTKTTIYERRTFYRYAARKDGSRKGY